MTPARRGRWPTSSARRAYRFLDRYRRSFDFQQLKAFRAIQRCRTAALGGHIDACPKWSRSTRPSPITLARNRALSEVPSAGLRANAIGSQLAIASFSATSYFHVGIHRAARAQCAGAGLIHPRVFYDLLFTCRQRTNVVESRTRSQTGPRCGNRCDQHSAYLGTGTCFSIRIFTASFRRAACLQTTAAGYGPAPLSFSSCR